MSYRTTRLDEHVIEILRKGGVGFMPSDTIYGLSCKALDEAAVERVYRLKKRDSDKPLIVLIANKSQLSRLGIAESEVADAEGYWPGPLTIICQMAGPKYLHRGTNSLAVRLPDDDNLLNLIKEVGPLVSTSANLQGGEPATAVTDAQAYFGDELDFYIDSGDIAGHQPSTLVKAVNGKLEVIRPGAVEIKED